MVQGKYNDYNFCQFFDSKISSLKKIQDVKNLVLEYENTKAEMRGSQSGKIVEKQLEQLLLKLENESGIKFDRGDVYTNLKLAQVYQDIENEKTFRLYTWQKIIVSFVRFVTNSLKKNIVVELPTGHGKTLIIAALAMAISQDAN